MIFHDKMMISHGILIISHSILLNFIDFYCDMMLSTVETVEYRLKPLKTVENTESDFDDFS
jgi:hypothetical protein